MSHPPPGFSHPATQDMSPRHGPAASRLMRVVPSDIPSEHGNNPHRSPLSLPGQSRCHARTLRTHSLIITEWGQAYTMAAYCHVGQKSVFADDLRREFSLRPHANGLSSPPCNDTNSAPTAGIFRLQASHGVTPRMCLPTDPFRLQARRTLISGFRFLTACCPFSSEWARNAYRRALFP